jgi:uncharacterized protein
MNEHSAALVDARAAYEADDVATAIERFTPLAEQGVIEACHYLGFIHKTEPNFMDPQRSGLWYGKYLLLLRRAAESGDSGALLSLGKHYQYGDLVGVDESKARSLILRAAQAGHAQAQFHLATLFLHGWCGCRRDEDLYLEWLYRAADALHPEALFKKGMLLRTQDADEEGMALIRRSAELGFWVAQEFIEQDSKGN